MEKLTHDFTQSVHDNHPPITWADALLQRECDRTQHFSGIRGVLARKPPWEEWECVWAHMCWNGKCRHAQIHACIFQTGYASVLCKLTFFQQHAKSAGLEQSAALCWQAAAHWGYHKQGLRVLLSWGSDVTSMTSDMEVKLKCNSRVQVLATIHVMFR